MVERLIAVNLLFCFILPMMVPARECLFADKSEKDKSRTSNSGDSAAMIAARMLLPLYPCRPRNFSFDRPFCRSCPSLSFLIWLPCIEHPRMFRVVACLSIAMATRSQDSVVLSNVTSFHNEVFSVIRHHLLLTLPSLMASRKGKCCMMLSIISVGRSMRLVDSCLVGFVYVLSTSLPIFVVCVRGLVVWFGDGLVLDPNCSLLTSCVCLLSNFAIAPAFLLTWFPEGMRPLLGCISLMMPSLSSLILIVHPILEWLGIPQ